jgi:glycosyltransferase involved in cell wall biosynthesis
MHSELFGGAERHTVDMVNHLAAAGRQVAFVQSGLDLSDYGLRAGAENLTILRSRLPVRGLSWPQRRRWRDLLRELPAPRVLFVKPWYYAGDPAFLRLLREAYPTVLHIEHSLPPRASRGCRLLFGILPDFGLSWRVDFRRRRRMICSADYVLTVSAAARRELIAQELYPPDCIIACPNGVECEYWRRDEEAGRRFRRQWGIGEDSYLFGFVGRLEELKGADLAIRALQILSGRGRHNAALCLVGQGTLRNEYEDLARRLEVSNRVHFVGPVADVRPAYSAMQTLVLPSKLESFPLVLLEAMSCGCRSIASNVGGVAEVLCDPAVGELLDSRDPQLWADAMQAHLAVRPADREERSARIRAVAERDHDARRRFCELERAIFAPPRRD